ncbi:MAG TPA: type II toxin-antitoxin system PemK/MazF family toxin [Mucilaginibacter sp.]|nr:type II toxin-antitoxin system PemK/MazF family toxin [Mucilaginibacter sp.]
MSKPYKKWEVVLVDLNPTRGAEIAKIRPCLVVSPNAVNTALSTLIVIPFTSTNKNYPTRLSTNHKGKPGALAFDQIKTIDKSRIVKKDGELDKNLREAVNTLLQILFSEE